MAEFNLISQPLAWSSAHRPIVYEFEYINRNVTITDNGGFCQLAFSSIGSPAEIGRRIFVNSGIYQGFHTVTQIIGANTFVTNRIYTANSTTTAKILFREPIEVFIGYKSTEEYPSQLPYTSLGLFNYAISPDFKVRIDISGRLANTFSITPPTTGIDFSRFNAYRLEIGGSETTRKNVLNSSILSDVLNNEFVNTGAVLIDGGVPLIPSCGVYAISFIDNNVLQTSVITQGDCVGDFSNLDFSNDFNICQ
jgi:hypothetical protein